MLPPLEDLKIFRSNQFYSEEYFFAGNTVDYYFINPTMLHHQLFTIERLQNSYDIKNLVLSNNLNDSFLKVLIAYPFMIDPLKSICSLPYIYRIKSQILFQHRMPTSGIMMILYALSLGFTTIYVSGLDFYEGDRCYAYDNHNTALLGEINDNENYLKVHGGDREFLQVVLQIAESLNAEILNINNTAHVVLKEAKTIYLNPYTPQKKNAETIISTYKSPVEMLLLKPRISRKRLAFAIIAGLQIIAISLLIIEIILN